MLFLRRKTKKVLFFDIADGHRVFLISEKSLRKRLRIEKLRILNNVKLFNKMRILVTGAAGFIGFHISNYLVKKKIKVI